jgi:hypothetical protein
VFAPTTAFRGNTELPAPIVFIRDHHNEEHEPPTLTGPLAPYRSPIQTDHHEATLIQELAYIADGRIQHCAPMWGGFQTIHQWLTVSSCPVMRMTFELRGTTLPLTTQRKWPLAMWWMPRAAFDAIGGLGGTPADPDFADVVKNRLPRVPQGAVLVRPQREQALPTWVIMRTSSPTLPGVRVSMWQPHAGGDVRVVTDGNNLAILAWVNGMWQYVCDRNVIPSDWAGQDIIFGIQTVDYASSDANKDGGGTPLTTQHYGAITVTAPMVRLLVAQQEPVPEPVPIPVEPLPAGFYGGANLPWHSWGWDFGAGHIAANAADIAQLLVPVRDNWLPVVRWWMFEGDALPRYLASPNSAALAADIRGAAALFRERGLQWQPALFASARDLLTATDSLGDAHFAALAALLAEHRDVIYSVDICNEPGWQVWNEGVDKNAVVAAVERVAARLHAQGLRCTVNSAMADEWAWWATSSLDHLQASWYEGTMRGGTWDVWENDAAFYRAKFGIPESTPLGVGEFYAGTPRDSGSNLPGFAERGYSHAFAWSANPGATQDHMTIDYASLGAAPMPEPEPEPPPTEVGIEHWVRPVMSDGTLGEPEWRPF